MRDRSSAVHVDPEAVGRRGEREHAGAGAVGDLVLSTSGVLSRFFIGVDAVKRILVMLSLKRHDQII